MSVEPGTRLGGRYVLSERLAIGGMGEVWRGRDEVLGRVVAVKILRPELSEDDAFRRRFRAEARTAGGLSHPGIAQVFDYGEAVSAVIGAPPSGHRGTAAAIGASGRAASGTPSAPEAFTDAGGIAYLVMELLPGEPLSAVISSEGALDSDRTMALVAQAARALHAAHLKGVIHRDIKPANLMISPDGAVKVTDFGIARPMDHEPLTATGQVMGTAHYLAPELARGEIASPLSDVYALGVVAYECLAGQRPFDGDNQVAVATAHLSQPPPPLSTTIPLQVRAVVAAAMAKEKRERIPSAAAFAEALEALRLRGTVEGTRAQPAVATALRALSSQSGVDPLVAAPAPVPAALPPPARGRDRVTPRLLAGTAALDLTALEAPATTVRSRARGGGPQPAAAFGPEVADVAGADVALRRATSSRPTMPGEPTAVSDRADHGRPEGRPPGYRRAPYGSDSGESDRRSMRPVVIAASAAAVALVIAGALTALGLMHSSGTTSTSTPSSGAPVVPRSTPVATAAAPPTTDDAPTVHYFSSRRVGRTASRRTGAATVRPRRTAGRPTTVPTSRGPGHSPTGSVSPTTAPSGGSTSPTTSTSPSASTPSSDPPAST